MLFSPKRLPLLDTCHPLGGLQPTIRLRLLLLLFSIVVLGGCASANGRYETLNAEIAKPINCQHAKMQIDLLEEAKVSKREKIANGIASILPTSIILNLITGEYSSRAKIASGKFDNTLYMKINAIHKECDEQMLSDMPDPMDAIPHILTDTTPQQAISSNKLAHTAMPLLPK